MCEVLPLREKTLVGKVLSGATHICSKGSQLPFTVICLEPGFVFPFCPTDPQPPIAMFVQLGNSNTLSKSIPRRRNSGNLAPCHYVLQL